MFVSTDKGARLNPRTLNQIVERVARKAGTRGRITPHTLRHSMATHMLRNKADLRHIQAILGHGSLDSTQVHTHMSVEDLKAVIRSAHPCGRRSATWVRT